MKRHHCAAFVIVAVLATASTHLARSQPPDVARRQYQEMRQNYTRALAALDRIEEHVAAKEYEPALAALEELVENKAKLDKAELPAIVKRSVSTWEPRILAFAKRIEEAGVRLPDSLAKRVRPPENPTRPLKPATGATRYEILGAKGISADGRRKLADFEIDVYGPLPFPETVAKFIDDEVSLLLELQNEDGSFRFLGGRKTEAGGTVGLVTQASLCGHSLREHVEVNPEAIEAALSKTLDYVVYMVRSGKLRTDVWDSTWRHTYALRFLVHEYPHVEDQRTKALVEDACGLLVDELRNLQQGTTAQKSQAVRWQMPSPPGMVVRDDAKTGRAVVAECPTDSPAHKAGIQEGDFLLTASGEPIDTVLGYYMNRMFWLGGDSIEIGVSRGGETKTLMMHLPHRFPGTLGFACEQDGDGGVTVAAFDPLSNPDRAPINVGDRIVKVDQTEIATLDEFTNLSFFSGQEVEVGIERDGRPQTLRLICVPQEAADFGVEIERSLDQTRLDGLTIKQLQSDSCLKGAGLEPGDRLLRINDTPILNRRRFRELERTFWGGQRVNVTYRSASDQ
ncbi:MAG: PDZ domain-containing protein, partial [bacterium]|nr:PDZ domain-containing protein [bacterium]